MASPRRAPSARQKVASAKRSAGHNRAPVTRAKSGGGIDLPKFAGEVSRNYARGVARVGSELNKAIPTRTRSSSVGGAVKSGPASNAYLRKALGGK